MNKYITNFYNLFSLDKKKSYAAILEKKDWLFRPLYVKCSFKSSLDEKGKTIYPSLFAIMDQCLPFYPFSARKELFVDHEDKKELIEKAFNSQFAVSYLFDSFSIPLKEGEFLLELDFAKMDNKTYKDLVANFYPCINTVEELDLFYNESSVEDLLKYPMYGENGKWVLILAKDVLMNSSYFLPIAKSIIYNSQLLDSTQIEGLEVISEKCSLKIMEVM